MSDDINFFTGKIVSLLSVKPNMDSPSMTFKILWGINAVIALIFVVFFFIGLADGSVSSFNITLWLVVLFALGGILWGSYAARSAGRTSLVTRLLMALAIPGVLIGLLFLAVLILQPKWN